MRKSPQLEKKKIKPRKEKPIFETSCGNIFIDLGFPEDEAINMLARCELMGEIREIIRARGWTQMQAAKVLKIAQPRVAEVMKMKADHYSIDMLMKLLYRLGRKVSLSITANNQVA